MEKCLCLAALCMTLASPLAAALADGYDYQRKYQVGSTYDYSLKTDTYENGKFISESIAKSHHEVVLHDGMPFEMVSFRSLRERKSSPADFINLDNFARQVPSFYISLVPGGTITVPDLTVAHMKGPITDLITCWVAVSTKVGIEQLHHVGDMYSPPGALTGKWSNATSTPVGEDVLAVEITLLALNEQTATFRVAFRPPTAQSPSLVRPWMAEPVSPGSYNNFQQVQASANGLFNAMWGRESFTITTTVSRSDGIIVRADMENTLSLEVRPNCNSALAGCARQIPFSIVRREELDLLGNN